MRINKKLKIYIFLGIFNLITCLILVHLFNFSLQLNTSNVWESFWQHIPEEFLLNNPIQNIFLLHGQPPLHNILYGIILNIFYSSHLSAFLIFQIILGSLNLIIIYYIIDNLITNNKIKITAMLVILLNPSFYLYQSYIMYTFITHLCLNLSVFFLIKYQKNNFKHLDRNDILTHKNMIQLNKGNHFADFKVKYLYLFILSVNILLLVRSSFHLVYLAVIIALVYFHIIINEIKNKKKILFVIFIISLTSVGWYLKNYIQYGFFGSSSWLGLNLYKFITTDFTFEMREKALKQNKLDEAITSNNHFYSNLDNFKEYGFNKKSRYDFLNQNNFHNINIPEISDLHKKNAFTIITMFPGHYVKNVMKSFQIFSKPSYTYQHLSNNKNNIKQYISFYNTIIYFDNFILSKISGNNKIYIINLIFIIVFLLAAPLLILKKYRQNYIISYIIITLFYFFLVSCLFETGENNRFSFITETLFFILKLKILEDILKQKWFPNKIIINISNNIVKTG